MIHYIYLGLDVKVNSEETDLDQLLEILNLAEKYGINDLVNEISDVIREELIITEDNVLEVSETAQMYCCFEKVSAILSNKCSSYYRNIKYKLSSPSPQNSFECRMTEEDNFVPEDESSQLNAEELHVKDSSDEKRRDKMSLSNVSWVKFLNTDAGLPHDITFKFYEKMKATAEGNDELRVGKFVGEIKAHKFLLASCSEVFKERLLHSSNSLINELHIEDSSYSAFKIMIDFMYGKFPRLRGRADICEIFEIENLADQYRIDGLKEEYRASMLLYLRYK